MLDALPRPRLIAVPSAVRPCRLRNGERAGGSAPARRVISRRWCVVRWRFCRHFSAGWLTRAVAMGCRPRERRPWSIHDAPTTGRMHIQLVARATWQSFFSRRAHFASTARTEAVHNNINGCVMALGRRMASAALRRRDPGTSPAFVTRSEPYPRRRAGMVHRDRARGREPQHERAPREATGCDSASTRGAGDAF